ncbi:MAG: PQQ-binding-like beta-propeller repeat protein [Phycisphaerales bacterium]|nr:PQQ-binding-like beta-propeller repeat protein [Phycisphaerales bacterium]
MFVINQQSTDGTRRVRCVKTLAIGLLLSASASADLVPQWVSRVPSGSTLYSGLRGMCVDAAGNTYITGNAGVSYNVDTLTAKLAPDGAVLWTSTFDGPAQWHDTISDVALGPDGSVYAVGSTPGAMMFADLLVLKYDPADGRLVWYSTFDGGSGISDGGLRVAVDREGNVYAGGSTVGDGGDCLTVKFDSNGNVQWASVWDGPAGAPYSQEAVRGIKVDPEGNVVIIADGVMNSLHPDYVVIKYDAADGSQIWMNHWGLNGDETPVDMVIDGAGDIYVTGSAFNSSVQFGTVKFQGGDGQILWAEYDRTGYRDWASALALDGQGGVYVTGTSDPHGDQSKMMHNFYTVKRDTADGALLWTHEYGDACLRCYDASSDVIVDRASHAFVVGTTSSPPYTSDQIMLVLDASNGAELDRGLVYSGTAEGVSGDILRLDGAANVFTGGNGSNFNTGEVEWAVVKYASLGGGVDCGAIRRLSAKCTDGRLTAKVVSSLPEGTELTLSRNGGDEKTLTINARGKGKVKWTGQTGAREVCIVECGSVPCATAECL